MGPTSEIQVIRGQRMQGQTRVLLYTEVAEERAHSPLSLSLFFLSPSSPSLSAQRMTRSAHHPHHVSGYDHVHVLMNPSPVHHHINVYDFHRTYHAPYIAFVNWSNIAIITIYIYIFL